MKYAAIQNIASNNNWHLLLFIPALARTAPPLLFLTTPYVRVDGIGSALSRHLPRFATAASILFTAATFLVFTQTRGLIIILFASCAFIIIRALLIRWIGGTTGDTAGAMIESIETILLLGSPLFR
jgi:adenosylcobinamide-GDP ribazoletransferase